jgi:transposase-like protein
MAKRYTKSFKLKVVEKAVNRSNNETLASMCNQYGIGYSTLTRWMYEVKQGKLSEQEYAPGAEEKPPQAWTAQEKLQAIVDTERLSEQDKGQYCRNKGIFLHQIAQWKQSIMSKSDNDQKQSDKAEIRALKEQNKRLQQELRRKEKALAEAAALLVLKKKAQALLEDEDD